jgi:hypothetical protein
MLPLPLRATAPRLPLRCTAASPLSHAPPSLAAPPPVLPPRWRCAAARMPGARARADAVHRRGAQRCRAAGGGGGGTPGGEPPSDFAASEIVQREAASIFSDFSMLSRCVAARARGAAPCARCRALWALPPCPRADCALTA